MNLIQINTIRASVGLAPLPADPNKQAQKRKQDANRAARAQESRELKAKRSKGGK